jgi:pyruvate dehydrogenase E2 component (dihydrolipoamide acetyltransferase)
MFKKNVKLRPYKSLSAWRKIAIGTWKMPSDPTIYGMVDVDATSMLALIDEYKLKGIRLTPVTIVARALALSLKENPNLNSILRLGRIYQRENVDIFLQVSDESEGEENLSGITIKNCDQKDLITIAQEIYARGSRIKQGDDTEYKKVKKSMGLIPGIFVGHLLKILGFILYELNLWSPLMQSPQDSFGSAMVTSVGNFGIKRGFAPLTPFSYCPILMLLGKFHWNQWYVMAELPPAQFYPLE